MDKVDSACNWLEKAVERLNEKKKELILCLEEQYEKDLSKEPSGDVIAGGQGALHYLKYEQSEEDENHKTLEQKVADIKKVLKDWDNVADNEKVRH